MNAAKRTPDASQTATGAEPLPAIVDAVIAAFVAIVGLAATVSGGVLLVVTDRELIETALAEESLDLWGIARADLVEVLESTVTWTAIGMVLTGTLLILGAVAYGVSCYRGRGPSADPGGQFWTIAVLGAIVTTVASFVPFSPAVGGGVAGYLDAGRSGRVVTVGALAGTLSIVPLLAVGIFTTIGAAQGALAIDGAGLALVVSSIALFGMVLSTVVSAGLGAVGGYVGGWIAQDEGV